MPEGSSERFQGRFDAGMDDSIEDATAKLMFLLSGRADALTGRHISIHDPEDEMIDNIDAVHSNDLYTLGLTK